MRALTPSQREALALAATGMTYTAVAQEMGVSEQTVKNHLTPPASGWAS